MAEKQLHYQGGRCVGCTDALKWVESLAVDDAEMKERVLNRMMYEFDKSIPIMATFHKGRYGSQYDHYTCGHCGSGIIEAHWKYCPKCGYSIGKTERDGERRAKYEQLTIFDAMEDESQEEKFDYLEAI